MIDQAAAEKMQSAIIDLAIETGGVPREVDHGERGWRGPLFDDVLLVEGSDDWELHLVLPVQRSGHAVGMRFILDADLSHDHERLAGFASGVCFEADEILRSKSWQRSDVELIDDVYWISDDDG